MPSQPERAPLADDRHLDSTDLDALLRLKLSVADPLEPLADLCLVLGRGAERVV